MKNTVKAIKGLKKKSADIVSYARDFEVGIRGGTKDYGERERITWTYCKF